MRSSPKEKKCSTCFWWTTPRRGKTCKSNRVVKISGKRVTGTPHDYVCDEYASDTFAKCGECIYWSISKRPMHKKPCSQLSLLDHKKKPRTKNSTFCDRFNQLINVRIEDNFNLRIEGQLVVAAELVQHSEPTTIVVRQSPTSGLMLSWHPSGPGQGSWTIIPVSFDNIEAGTVSVEHFQSPFQEPEIRFAGSVRIECQDSSQTTMTGQKLSNMSAIGVSRLVIDMERIAPRTFDGDGVKESQSQLGALPDNIQDEPWGDSWTDLKDQCRILMASGHSEESASRAVSIEFFRERKTSCSEQDRLRLETQLILSLTKNFDV